MNGCTNVLLETLPVEHGLVQAIIKLLFRVAGKQRFQCCDIKAHHVLEVYIIQRCAYTALSLVSTPLKNKTELVNRARAPNNCF